jgi:glycosyltransferase involved in cell wall biosynthesis
MIGKSHVLIAQQLYQTLESKDHHWISKTAFIKGSTKPDALTYRFKGRHTIEASLDFVDTLVHEILDSYKPRHYLGYFMGELIHFFTDYAVAYHSNPNYNEMYVHPKHLIYELKLHRVLKKTMMCFEGFETMTLDNYPEVLVEYVLRRHQGAYDQAQDVVDAYQLSYRMFQLVFQAYKEKFLKEEARNPIKVAIFTDTYLPQINGVSNTLYEYARYLDNQKIQYIIVSPKVSNADPKNAFIERLTSIAFWFYKEARIGLSRKSHIHNLMRAFDPDVIHVMTEFTVGSIGLKYAQQHRIPVITNYSSHFTLFLKHLHLGFVARPLERYISHFHRQSALTTTPSLDSMNILQEKYGVENVQLFSRGIDTERFNPSKRNMDLRRSWEAEDKIVILCVSRISGEKNLECLFESYQQLDEPLKEQSQLRIVGDGPLLEKYRKKYPFAHFLGYQTGEALAEIYASADVFAFPSHSETLGNVVLEAMASRLPCIVVNRGGVMMNVVHRQHGWVTDFQDRETFKTALIEAIIQPELRYQYAKEAWQAMQSKSWANVFNKLLVTYKHMLQSATTNVPN